MAEDRLALAESVVALARALVGEMKMSAHHSVGVTLDSKLEGDLGLGSLARMELLTRVERQLGVGISEQAFMTAETLRDVVRAVHRQVPLSVMAGGTFAPRPEEPPAASAPIPDSAKTLQATLAWHVERHPGRPHIYPTKRPTSPPF
jgi:acyl carrier protein